MEGGHRPAGRGHRRPGRGPRGCTGDKAWGLGGLPRFWGTGTSFAPTTRRTSATAGQRPAGQRHPANRRIHATGHSSSSRRRAGPGGPGPPLGTHPDGGVEADGRTRHRLRMLEWFHADPVRWTPERGRLGPYRPTSEGPRSGGAQRATLPDTAQARSILDEWDNVRRGGRGTRGPLKASAVDGRAALRAHVEGPVAAVTPMMYVGLVSGAGPGAFMAAARAGRWSQPAGVPGGALAGAGTLGWGNFGRPKYGPGRLPFDRRGLERRRQSRTADSLPGGGMAAGTGAGPSDFRAGGAAGRGGWAVVALL